MKEELITVHLLINENFIDSQLIFHSLKEANQYISEKRILYLDKFNKSRDKRIFDLIASKKSITCEIEKQKYVADDMDENGNTTGHMETYIVKQGYNYESVKSKLNKDTFIKCLDIFNENFIFESKIIKLKAS